MNKEEIGFKEHEVRDYERKRYRGIDQRIVNAREQKILRKFLQNISDSAGFVLDLPCGYGRFSSLLHSQRLPVVNSDISFHMVKRARERVQSPVQGLRMGVVVDAKRGLPFKSSIFPCVFSLRFFHHLHEKDDRVNILQEFFRVSNAWIILSYYQMNILHLLQRKLRRKFKKSRTRIKMLSRKQIQGEIEDVGFKVVGIRSLFRGLHAQRIALLKKSKT